MTEAAALPWQRARSVTGAADRLTRLADEILTRCRGEGPANCVARCPLHVDARGYVMLAAKGDYRAALQVVRDKLPFPGILGYVCTHPCELHCKRIDEDSAVRVRDIKRYLAEWEPGEPQHLLDREPPRDEQIAVVGSGPAGLIAAHDLSRLGYAVTMFEKEQRIGGCLSCKIPGWRLPRRIVDRDLSIINALGIDVRTRVRIGRDISLEQLSSSYSAVLVLSGFAGGLDLLDGSDAELGRTITGTIRVDPLTCETGVPGVFAGGEAVSGPGCVIDSLAQGRRCAESAHCSLTGRDPRLCRDDPFPGRLLWTLTIDEAERRRRERTPMTLQPFDEPLGEQEVRDEAARCLDCECRLCVKDCEFLDQHSDSPKDLARRVKAGLDDDGDIEMLYSCNVCSLCSTVCPENLDTGAMLMEARRRAVEQGSGPLLRHRRTIDKFRAATSKTFSLVLSEPGRSRSKRLFFTGCALPAVMPKHTLAIYDELRRHHRGTGVLTYCCGAPVEQIGMEQRFDEARQTLLRMVDSVGADELVTACPDCTYTLTERLPELRVTTVWELLAESWTPPRLRAGETVSIHDSCRTRDTPGVRSAVRRLVESGGGRFEDVEYSGCLARCCGLGGMIRPIDPALSRRIADRCAAESPRPMVTYCIGCRQSLARTGKQAIHILDFLLASDWRRAALRKSPGTVARHVNRLRVKYALKRLRPLGSE